MNKLIGILLILLGIFAIAHVGWTSEFTIIILGCFLTIGGIFQIILSYRNKQRFSISHPLFIALFYIVAGLLFIFKPLQSAEGITLLIGALLLIGGSVRIFNAFQSQYSHRGLIGFSGVFSIVLGLLILIEWPSSSLWVIGLFVGMDLILIGWFWLILSLAGKNKHPNAM